MATCTPGWAVLPVRPSLPTCQVRPLGQLGEEAAWEGEAAQPGQGAHAWWHHALAHPIQPQLLEARGLRQQRSQWGVQGPPPCGRAVVQPQAAQARQLSLCAAQSVGPQVPAAQDEVCQGRRAARHHCCQHRCQRGLIGGGPKHQAAARLAAIPAWWCGRGILPCDGVPAAAGAAVDAAGGICKGQACITRSAMMAQAEQTQVGRAALVAAPHVLGPCQLQHRAGRGTRGGASGAPRQRLSCRELRLDSNSRLRLRTSSPVVCFPARQHSRPATPPT